MRISQDEINDIREVVMQDDVFMRSDVFEKDLLLTKVISAIAGYNNENVQIIFCGGTSLSKAYGIISRMSEDADFKIVVKDVEAAQSRSQIRKHLSGAKQHVHSRLCDLGFKDVVVKARDENRFFAFDIGYEPAFPSMTTSLKPHIQVECINIKPMDEPVMRPVASMVNRILGKSEPAGHIACMTLQETASEKIVALLRRLGEERNQGTGFKPYLLRHVYDLSRMFSEASIPVDERFVELIQAKVAIDQRKFANHFAAFHEAPYAALAERLDFLCESEEMSKAYTSVLSGLMFTGVLPPYAEAVEIIEATVRPLLQKCQIECFAPNLSFCMGHMM